MIEEPTYGEVVEFNWSKHIQMRGRVREIYGEPGNRQVVLDLLPELSPDLVYEPKTLALELSEIRRTAAA